MKMLANFGLRAHDFGTLPAEELAQAISTSGARCVQLALSKALPDTPMLPQTLGVQGLQDINTAFSKSKIDIAVLGCYIDMVTLNLNEREQSLQRFESHLQYASALDCKIVGTETGSPIPYADQKEEAFQVAKTGLLRLIRYAEGLWENGQKIQVGVEPVADMHALSSAKHARQLIQEADSPALGIIFDPTNLIPQSGIENTDHFLDECFDAFGEHIIAVHAKDYRMLPSQNGPIKSGPIPAGEGEMDWAGLFSRLASYNKQHVPILLEDTGPEKATSTFHFLNELATQHYENS
jgi:sugar phosphate isomerase/epimerase